MFDDKVTKSGTRLPVMSLKGKPYLQVAYRLVWFREDQPKAAITTEAITITDDYAVFKATITGEDGKIVATGHKRDDKTFSDFVEKAETGAIGRALAAAGYGTQFDPSFDEGERLADSPIEVPNKKSSSEVRETKGVQKTGKTAKDDRGSNGTDAEKPITLIKNIPTSLKDTLCKTYNIAKEQGKITSEVFKREYLNGTGLKTATEAQVADALNKMKINFPEFNV